MNEQLMSLSKVFTEKLFRIPDYQRGFAWGAQEISDFWNDLNTLTDSRNHYVGVLTLEPVTSHIYKEWTEDLWLIESKKFAPYYVVDGQQRLTTSIILIAALLEIAVEKGLCSLNYTKVDDIYRQFIANVQPTSSSKSFLFCYEKDNPSHGFFTNHILDTLPTSRSLKNETTYTRNLEDAKSFFCKKMSTMTIKELELLYAKISQRMLFNTYQISSDIDVFVTFETMNNRGKPLSKLELLKNRMIYLSTLFDTSEDIKASMRESVNNAWKEVYHVLGKSFNLLRADDEFLGAYFYVYFVEQDDKKIAFHREQYVANAFHRYGQAIFRQDYLLDNYFVPDNIISGKLTPDILFKFIQSMNQVISFWGVLINPQQTKYSTDIKEYISKINYLSHYSFQSGMGKIMVLMCLMQKPSSKSLLNLLKIMERYLFLQIFIPRYIAITNHYSKAFDEMFYMNFGELILPIGRNQLTVEQVIDKMKQKLESIELDVKLKQNIIQYYGHYGFYREEFLYYFLREYELRLEHTSKNGVSKVDFNDEYTSPFQNNDSIEHIYPQNPRDKHWQQRFGQYSPKEKKCLKNSLGNFVLLSSHTKNAKLGNKSFDDKKAMKNTSLGYRFGSYSEIEIAQYNEWSATEIKDRGIKMTRFLCERWGFKLCSNDKEMVEFLGLLFL